MKKEIIIASILGVASIFVDNWIIIIPVLILTLTLSKIFKTLLGDETL